MPSSESAELSGLWLTTAYPEVTERLGEEIRLDLVLSNRNLPPRRVDLDVAGLPEGWVWEINGGGKPVTAAMVAPGEQRDLRLEITPKEGTGPGSFEFRVLGEAASESLELPITLALKEAEPARLELEADLPALRGSPNSNFDYEISVTNDSTEDATVNLLARAPAGFHAVFKEQYGSQELTSLPVKAGETKDFKVSVEPPQNIDAGQYEVVVEAAAGSLGANIPLMLDVTGQPELALQGPEGRLSGTATAGSERTFTFTLLNTGSADTREVSLSATPPSGWKVEFEPERVAVVPPGKSQDVSVTMTPSEKAIAGDYMVQMRASGAGVSDSADFRVTVTTSTMWGIAGLGVIGAALVVLAAAVTRYGRR